MQCLTSEHRHTCQSDRTADELWLFLFARLSGAVDSHGGFLKHRLWRNPGRTKAAAEVRN